MTKKVIMLIVTGFMLASFSIIGWAEPDMMRHARMRIHMAEKNLISAHLLLKFKDEIGLTQEQTAKIEKMQDMFHEQSIRKDADTKILEMKLKSYLKTDKIDRSKLEKMIRDIAALRTNSQIDRMNYLLDLKAMLSADQLKKIDQLKKEHRRSREFLRKKRGDFRKPGMRGDRNVPPPPPEEPETEAPGDF